MSAKRGKGGRFVGSGAKKGGASFELKGAVEMERALRKIRNAAKRAIRDEVHRSGLELLARTADKTPLRSGGLLGSMFIGKPWSKRSTVGVRLGYTGAYAAAVHEGFHGGLGEENQFQTPNRGWYGDEVRAFKAQFKARISAKIESELRKATAAAKSGGIW